MTSTTENSVEQGKIAADAPELRAFVMALFFIFGGVTSLNDITIPKLKSLFALDHMQAMLVQSAFFAAYFLVSLPAAALVRRLGFLRGAVAGLLVMTLGCLLFVPIAQNPAFPLFLAALFVLASGVTMVQVVANPLISLLGPPQTAHSRLTFAQAFNSLGTTIFPFFGAMLILGGFRDVDASKLSGAALDAFRQAEAQAVAHAYVGIALALGVIAAAVWAHRGKATGERHAQGGKIFSGFDLLRKKRFGFGAAAIFLYVGAEVSIGSLLVLYLVQPHVLALDERAAGEMIPLYWGGALVGRFIGSALLRALRPGLLLMGVALGAAALIALSALSTGPVAAFSLLAVGLMNSIQFPTIFSLASEKLGARAAEGSGVICMAIVGGAILPPLTGRLADLSGSLSVALIAPALCYLLIAAFGFFARRPAAA